MQAPTTNKAIKKSFGISHLLGLSDDDDKAEKIGEKEHKPQEVVKINPKSGATRKRKRKKEDVEDRSKLTVRNFQSDSFFESEFKPSVALSPFNQRSSIPPYPIDSSKRFKQDSKSFASSTYFNPYIVQNNFPPCKPPSLWSSLAGKVTPGFAPDTVHSRYHQNIPLTYLSMWQQNLLALSSAVKSRFNGNPEVADPLENSFNASFSFYPRGDHKHLGFNNFQQQQQQHNGSAYLYNGELQQQQQQQQHKSLFPDNMVHRWPNENMHDNTRHDLNEYKMSKNSNDDVTKRFQSPSHFGENLYQSNFHFQNSNSVDVIMNNQSEPFHEEMDNSGCIS